MRPDPKKVKAVFVEAVQEHDPKDWDAFLEQACGGDRNLREEVEVLLKAARRSRLVPRQGRGRPRRHDRSDPDPRTGWYRDRPLQTAGADRRRGHGRRLHGRASKPVKRRVALKIIKPGMDTQAGDRPLRGRAAGTGDDGPSQHRQGARCAARPNRADPTSSWSWSRACRHDASFQEFLVGKRLS